MVTCCQLAEVADAATHICILVIGRPELYDPVVVGVVEDCACAGGLPNTRCKTEKNTIE